jgi:hypothetical protein
MEHRELKKKINATSGRLFTMMDKKTKANKTLPVENEFPA